MTACLGRESGIMQTRGATLPQPWPYATYEA